MRTITREELDEILINHQHWLDEDCDGWEDMRADLSNANLWNANLWNANLWNANLWNANLSNANLWNADLSNANLWNANLWNANLWNANLWNANLWNADLWNANLWNANLSNANLWNADLWNAVNISHIPLACPDTGGFIAWKKAHHHIVKLFVPPCAKRVSATSRKCRCNRAYVIAIENLDGSASDLTIIESDYNKNFVYEVGKIVEEKEFDENRWNECSEGIHFFINRQEAVDY